MLAFERFCINPLDDRQISIAELLACAGDHLGKLAALSETDVDLNEIIALTQPLFTALGGKITDEVSKKAIQKARTSALRAKREEILKELSRVNTSVQDPFPEGSETYIEIFPNGLTAFREAPLDGLEYLLEAMLDNAAPFSESFRDLNPLIDLTAQFSTMRGEQLEKKGATAGAAEMRREACAALRLQLFDNLLFIARRIKGQPDEMRNYFNQSLLEDPASPGEPEPEPDPEP